MKRLALLAMGWMVCGVLWADLPPDCAIRKVKEQIIIPAKNRGVVYFYNTLPSTVYLVFNRGPNGTKPKPEQDLTKALLPKSWASLVVNVEEALTFHCVESKPGSEQRLPCQDVMRVCASTTPLPNDHAATVFWGVNSQKLADVTDRLILDGLIKRTA